MAWAAHLAPMIASLKELTTPPPPHFNWVLSPTEVLKTISIEAPNVLNADFQCFMKA